MFAKLSLTALALTLAVPVLAKTTSVITGGPAPTCIAPSVTPPAGNILPVCTASDMAAKGGDKDDDESEGDED
jgi:hypothetical protein